MRLININKSFSYAFILLITSGAYNWIFSETILVGWKQFIILICYVLAFQLVLKNIFLRNIYFFSIFLQGTLIITSLLSDVSLKVVLYNAFYYSSWVPFFIWSVKGGCFYYTSNYNKFTTLIIVFSALGLIIDSQTDMFSFLMTRDETLVTNYYLDHAEVVKRSVFIFTTSTLVMPTLAGIITINLLNNPSTTSKLISIITISIAIFTSATANSFLIGSCVVIGILLSTNMVNYRRTGVVLVLVLVNSYTYTNMIDSLSYSQIIDHTNLDNEGNIGRFILWEQAFRDISDFNLIEHIFGSGLGTTNENNGNLVLLHTHGESSFLQAYLEGGLFGSLLRLLPFIMTAVIAIKYKALKSNTVTIWYVSALFLAFAVAPIFGNIPSQTLLGFLIGNMYFIRNNYQSATRLN